MAISFYSNTKDSLSFDEFLCLTKEKIKFGNEDSLLQCNELLLKLSNNKTFFIDFLNSQLKDNFNLFQSENSYNEQSFLLFDCSDFYIRVTYWPKYSSNQKIKSEQDKTFTYNLAHDHNFSLLTAGYKGEGYWTKIWEYDYEKIIGFSGEKVDMKFLEETNLCEGKAMYYIPNKDIHLQLPPKSEDSLAINIILKSYKQFNNKQFDFNIENKTIKNVIYGSSSSKFGILKLASHVNDEKTIELLMNLIKKNEIKLVKEEALISLSKIISDKDFIIKLIKDDISLCKFYESRINLF